MGSRPRGEGKTERRGKREESRDKRDDIMNRAINWVDDSTYGIEASQDHDDKDKREEREDSREEREE